MAIKGVAFSYAKRGKHIIVSKLEHPSVYSIVNFLETLGYEISYVNNDENGLIDFEDLRKLIREDTILVSICAVNSETGVKQPLKTIRQVIKKANQNTVFHSDMTQAIGKIPVHMQDVDLASMSGHKVFGPKGIGFLYKNSKVNLVPIIHGSGKFNELRAGTPPLPLVVALSKALRIALSDLEKKEAAVKLLNEKVCDGLSKLDRIVINKTKYSIPHILNISLMDVKPETLIHALEEDEIYISTNTACSSGDLSTAVMAIFGDKQRAITTVRISLSYVTTNEEIVKFLNVFTTEYKKLKSLMGEIV